MGQKLQLKKLGNGELQHLIKISNLTHQMGTLTVNFSSKTEESSQFRKEYQMRKLKQDEGLDIISEGLGTLKDLAHNINAELDRELPLIGEIETKVDKVTSDIKCNSVRLKENLNKVRSSWNFCVDIILVCIVLGIAFYLYKYSLRLFTEKTLKSSPQMQEAYIHTLPDVESNVL